MKKTTKKIIASALAAAMVMASSVMTFADEASGEATTLRPYEELTKCDVSTKMTVEDGVATVTISLSGECSMFDVGIMYDADTMTYASYKKVPDFGDAFDAVNGSIIVNNQKDQSYVVIGATCTEDSFEYNGEALLVKFNVTGDEAAPVKVVKDSKYLLDAYNANKATGTLEEFVESDKAPQDAPDPEEVKPEENGNGGDDGNGGNTGDNGNGGNNGGDNQGNQGDNQNGNTNNNNAGNNNAPAATTAAPAAPAATTAAAANNKKSPKTGDAGVVLPIVAICGAAAAVVVASKKKVED